MEQPSESPTDRPATAASATQCLPPPRPGTGTGLPPASASASGAERPPADVGTPALRADGDSDRRWSRTSVGLLTATAALLVGALLVHLTMIFLVLSPPNAITATHRDTIQSYIQPEFGQDWKLFAPNPKQRNDSIGARFQTTGNGRSTPRLSEWINITAQDLAAIRGSLAPSHVHQDMVRRAWDDATSGLGTDERPKNRRGEIDVEYLKRIVLQRIGREWQGERIVGVQIAGRYTMVQPPSWSSEKSSDTTTYRVLPWWPVTDQDYKGL